MDLRQIASAVSSRTRAILPVHVFGRPCDMVAILDVARRLGIHVIEDACEAIGATCYGRQVGTFGDLGVFAFYPNKQMTTGEGGMVVTDNAEYATLCRSWRNQGRGEADSWLQHERLGFNYRLPEMNCALGLAQLTRLSDILTKRAAAARTYSEILSDSIPEVLPPAKAQPGMTVSWFVYVVRLSEEFDRSERDAILAHLTARGIGCSNYFTPIHLQPFYRTRFGYARGDFPVTERVAEHTIALPFFTDIQPDQIREVCSALRQAISAVRAERSALVPVGVACEPESHASWIS